MELFLLGCLEVPGGFSFYSLTRTLEFSWRFKVRFVERMYYTLKVDRSFGYITLPVALPLGIEPLALFLLVPQMSSKVPGIMQNVPDPRNSTWFVKQCEGSEWEVFKDGLEGDDDYFSLTTTTTMPLPVSTLTVLQRRLINPRPGPTVTRFIDGLVYRGVMSTFFIPFLI